MTADYLGQLYKKSFPDNEAARAYQMHRSKCASVIKNVLGPHFKAHLAQDIGDSYYSSIIKSTDVSVTKFLAISIIYHSVTKSTIVTTFRNLCTLDVFTADPGYIAPTTASAPPPETPDDSNFYFSHGKVKVCDILSTAAQPIARKLSVDSWASVPSWWDKSSNRNHRRGSSQLV
ncbi:hypothetical protein HPB49_013377 [Dermacentor silvarum]|uniref:Uncharacterized protein n=1 Tax=Dermacentor silvarum TaxID=543639 RepID=A0ACB8C3X3_DERSI|nr:hypothetical protein HPB49_013377 [Dermacentor silvarum]